MQAVSVDDTSPLIQYSGVWGMGTPHTNDWNQTITLTADANASFRFTFTGTSITVWGCQQPDVTSLAAFTLDSAPHLVRNDTGSPVYLNQVLQYQSPTLAPGTHTLDVQVLQGGSGATYCFDYLQYVPSVVTVSATPGIVAPTANVASSTPGADVAEGKSTNLGVVLPAVLVPCLLVIAGLIVALVYARRRRTAPAAIQSTGSERSECSYVATTPYAPFAAAATAEKDIKVLDKDGNPFASSRDSTYSSEAPPTYMSQ